VRDLKWSEVASLFIALGRLVVAILRDGKDPAVEITRIARSYAAKQDFDALTEAAFGQKFRQKPETD